MIILPPEYTEYGDMTMSKLKHPIITSAGEPNSSPRQNRNTRAHSFARYLAVLLLLICCPALSSNLRKDFSDAEAQYQSGAINEFASLLLKLKPNSDTERAFILYYSAIIDKDTVDMTAKLDQLVKTLPQTYYGQLGLLLLAKNAILDRKITEASTYLRKITHADITERLYWQAFCAYQDGEMNSTITHAENYLRLSGRGAYIEEAHYLIAEAYIRQRKYSSAVSTLNKFKALDGYPTDQQYFHYKLGYSLEHQGSIEDALHVYEQGYKINKLSQLAYQIEDRLFEMRSRHGNAIDLGFLYEYTDLSIVREIQQGSTEIRPGSPTQTTIPMPQELKLLAKPTHGMYLQAGRLSHEQNTIRLVNQIRDLGITSAYYEDKQNNKVTWVVLCGPFAQRVEADNARAVLIDNGIECFVTIIK